MVHDIFLPLTSTSQTRETERATSTTTYKIPSPELFTYTYKDTRSRTSEFHDQLQSTRDIKIDSGISGTAAPHSLRLEQELAVSSDVGFNNQDMT